MSEILLFLATHCRFLFYPGGFRFVDSSVASSFGGDAVVVLESSTTRMRFSWDRAQLLLEFQPVTGPAKDWFSVGLLRGVLQGNRGGSEVLSEDWAKFLGESLEQLEDAFRDSRRDEMIAKLRTLAKERAKELFG